MTLLLKGIMGERIHKNIDQRKAFLFLFGQNRNAHVVLCSVINNVVHYMG